MQFIVYVIHFVDLFIEDRDGFGLFIIYLIAGNAKRSGGGGIFEIPPQPGIKSAILGGSSYKDLDLSLGGV